MNVVSFRDFLKPSCSLCEFKVLPCLMDYFLFDVVVVVVIYMMDY